MSDHKPRRGDKLWDQGRLPDQPNGVIIMVDWEEGEVTVQFHDGAETRKQYSFNELENHWDGDFMGGWYRMFNRVSMLR